MDSLKLVELEKIIKSYKKVIVAFSGGVDSSFILYYSVKILGYENVLAVVGVSQTYTEDELKNAKNFSDKLNVKLIEVNTNEFDDQNFINNTKDRCYYCKRELYSAISKIAKDSKIDTIIDGSNYSDITDYRPGKKASSEYGVKSPLVDTKITKDEIRIFLKNENIDFYDKPANPCLASRIPYNQKITKEKLIAIEKGETFLKSLGFKIVRVRHHDLIARIEIDKNDFTKIINEEARYKITEYFKTLGFIWTTLDLTGYEMGSLNK
ncbi:MAG TPA: ATP-dependent sacrificial sulfur transferase LarE, partial [Spirochaetota bacterium]|nr:ATP-dependent sacrificial sulfur transferase LarE [Spirochaetota bacterium]